MKDTVRPPVRSILPVTSRDREPELRRFGTAFVIGRTRTSALLVTCAHVVSAVGGGDQLQVGSSAASVIATGSPDGADDLAILEADLSADLQPIGLEFVAAGGRDCVVHGIDAVYTKAPLDQLYEVRSIQGKIGQPTVLHQPGNPSVMAWQLDTPDVPLPAGFSGSPVIDVATGDAIGIAAIRRREQTSAIAISIQALRQIWPHGAQQLERPTLHRGGLEFVYVPGGSFSMGTSDLQAGALAKAEGRSEYEQEAPRRLIQTRGYFIARVPTTNAQYARYIEATDWPVPYRSDDLSGPFNWDAQTRRYPDGRDDWPVVLVSWHDAQRYCRWIGGRLPTEAEWEKAARGTDDAREWPWGDEWDPNRCNTVEGGRRCSTPVGRFSPTGDSPFGVADMAGNVWEWCSSLADRYPYAADDGRENVAAVGGRVLRGGAWGNNRYQARCATRNSTSPNDSGFTIGFRVALSKESVVLEPLD